MSNLKKALAQFKQAQSRNKPAISESEASTDRIVSPITSDRKSEVTKSSKESVKRPTAVASRIVNMQECAVAAAAMNVHDAGMQTVVGDCRAIKRPIISNALGRKSVRPERGNLVMITSALPAEGKTFVTVNLALSIAREAEVTVLLVDGDCAKRDLTRQLKCQEEPGLLDVLADPRVRVSDVVLPTSVPSLEFLPSGTPAAHMSELFGGGRASEVMDALEQSDPNRIVIFDSSPVLLTDESLVLSGQVGQIVLVVRASRTPQSAVIAAIEKLDNTRPVNAILNGVEAIELNAYGGVYPNYYGTSVRD